jgi:hypothetical protein
LEDPSFDIDPLGRPAVAAGFAFPVFGADQLAGRVGGVASAAGTALQQPAEEGRTALGQRKALEQQQKAINPNWKPGDPILYSL